jgi:outer membrane protein TolC
MIYRVFLITAMLMPIIGACAQDSLRLFDCYRQVAANNPVAKQKQLYADATDARIKSIETAYLPALNLNAQASYQSDVTKLAFNTSAVEGNTQLQQMLAGLKSAMPEGQSKDQYKAYIDVNQLIYDGGLTPARKAVETATANVQIKSSETELYQLNDRVNQLFFALLMVQENIKALQLTQNELETRIKLLESGVRNGSVLALSLYQVKADYIKVGQQIDDLRTQAVVAYASLGELTGKPVDPATPLARPKFEQLDSVKTDRPEKELYELQKTSYEQNKTVIAAGNLPRVSAFGQAGYGRPGLNMLDNSFAGYYMVGIRLSWNIFDWGQRKSDIKYLDIQKSIADTHLESFSLNQRIAENSANRNIEKYRRQATADNEILNLRKEVLRLQTSKFENGTLDAADYLSAVNAETQARITLTMHEIQMLQSQADLYYNEGKLNALK